VNPVRGISPGLLLTALPARVDDVSTPRFLHGLREANSKSPFLRVAKDDGLISRREGDGDIDQPFAAGEGEEGENTMVIEEFFPCGSNPLVLGGDLSKDRPALEGLERGLSD